MDMETLLLQIPGAVLSSRWERGEESFTVGAESWANVSFGYSALGFCELKDTYPLAQSPHLTLLPSQSGFHGQGLYC